MRTNTLFLIVLPILMFACSKAENAVVPALSNGAKPDSGQAQSIWNYIRSLGCPDSLIQDEEDYFIADGDILFSKNTEIPAIAENAQTEQAHFGLPSTIYNGVNQHLIRVNIDASAESSAGSILRAMNNWNNVGGSSIFFKEVELGGWNVLVTTGTVANGVAQATLPTGGRPGSVLTIDPAKFNRTGLAQGIAILMHEFGHIVGLAHTNWQVNREATRYNIYPTPSSDAQSIMNSPMASGVTTFSPNDVKAIRILYPKAPYNVRIGSTGQLSWTGPLTWIRGYEVAFEIRANNATGRIISAERIVFVGQRWSEGDFNVPLPMCTDCPSAYYIKAKVRTVHYDGYKTNTGWSPYIAAIVNNYSRL